MDDICIETWLHAFDQVWIAEAYGLGGAYCPRAYGATEEEAVQALEALLAQDETDRAADAREALEDERRYQECWA